MCPKDHDPFHVYTNELVLSEIILKDLIIYSSSLLLFIAVVSTLLLLLLFSDKLYVNRILESLNYGVLGITSILCCKSSCLTSWIRFVILTAYYGFLHFLQK